MSAPLPSWADTSIGRALVAEIIAEQPDYFIRSGTWIEGGGVRVYKGKLAGQLRRIHNEWLERELAALDARFVISGEWDDEASKALFRAGDGNQLIERVLGETEAPARVAA